MSAALQGIRIVDMTHAQAGPACTQILAWLGAEVIKVEQPGTRDNVSGADSILFPLLNANKKSLTLNLKTEDGKTLFRKLVTRSDVLVENFSPNALTRLGLGYDSLAQLNPRIIFASIKGFGTYGPYSTYKCFEPVAQAMGGAMCASGYPDSPPTLAWAAIGDTGSGMHCAIGILAALQQRHHTGRGQFVEVSMQDAVVNLMRVHLRQYVRQGGVPARTGNRYYHNLPGTIYPCSPGGANDYVYIVVRGNTWPAFARAIGRADLLEDARFSTEAGRWEASETIEAIIADWTRQRTKHEAMRTLGAAGIPCGACQDMGDLLNDPHLREREMIVDMDSGHGKYSVIGCPVKLADSPVHIDHSPQLGEHTDALLSELCEVSPRELERLRREGVT